MYDVFISVLKTPMDYFFVRKHEGTMSAQLMCKDYVNHMKISICSDIKIEKLMTQLTSNRLYPNFRGTTLQFIIDWIDKMGIYEELIPQTLHWPNNIKKVMLQNAVSDLQVFKSIKVTENIDIAQGRGPISHHNYVHLLQNVAAQHDESMISPKRANS